MAPTAVFVRREPKGKTDAAPGDVQVQYFESDILLSTRLTSVAESFSPLFLCCVVCLHKRASRSYMTATFASQT